ncbi:VOC family protein [Bacillus horti]|uniref:Enzyme related to lactoylglutathione lyase n=1 Tax=Caldalkalibacillus horti TaxID=77523 RepID=A0ABT9VYF0_9BACI|nr:VOC family protein [Bacillus horti]MDQ0166016.1 putative enzyme related to lactoylglutathione lyase [Bacillus horti]
MITKAIQITVFVRDQGEAKAFYTEKLGFVVCADIEFAPGWSYLTVAPSASNETVIELVKADTPEREALIGKQGADQVLIMFATDDIERDYEELKARGVVFHGEPKSVPGGRGVGFEDLYGNQLDLFQQD